jgi:hypothetical protein
MSMAEIETTCKVYNEARTLLAERVAVMKDGIDALHRTHLPGIKRALQKVAEIDARGKALVVQHPELFTKPKTLVLHGTKVGFAKGRGKIKFDKPELVVKRIKAQFPDQAKLLIHLEEKPNKEALTKMQAADLRKLGCTITEAGDQPVMQGVDTAVDKLVAALVKDLVEEADSGGDE